MREDECPGTRRSSPEYCVGCLGYCPSYSEGAISPGLYHYKTPGYIHVFCGFLVSCPVLLSHPSLSGSANRYMILIFSYRNRITGVSIYRTVMLKIFATSTNPTCTSPPTQFHFLPVNSSTNQEILCRGQCRWRLLVYYRSRRWSFLCLHASHAVLTRSPTPFSVRLDKGE